MMNDTRTNSDVIADASAVLAKRQIPPPPVANHRCAHRQRIAASGTLYALGSTDAARAIKVLVLDFSITGVAFRTSLHSMRGEKFRLELNIGPMKVTSNVLIAWCRPRADTYLCGAAFVE